MKTNESSTKSNREFLWIIVLIVILALVGLVIWELFKFLKSNENSQTTTPANQKTNNIIQDFGEDGAAITLKNKELFDQNKPQIVYKTIKIGNIIAKIESVSGGKIKISFENSGTDAKDVYFGYSYYDLKGTLLGSATDSVYVLANETQNFERNCNSAATQAGFWKIETK